MTVWFQRLSTPRSGRVHLRFDVYFGGSENIVGLPCILGYQDAWFGLGIIQINQPRANGKFD